MLTICAIAATIMGASSRAQAQATANNEPAHVLVSLRYSATRANSPPGSCGCFLLQGAALDAALPFTSRLSAVLEAAGNHANVVPGTSRQLSTVTLLAGPRYTAQFGLRHSVFAQGIFGAVRGFDADFRRGNDATDTATAFAYAIGGGYAFRLTHTVELRPIQLDLLQTNLPNGANSRQRNLRFGAGVAFTVPLGIARR
ncbi:hypothetical protein [Terriglobus aquaticus]|uniref:Outer membrane protein beta-barrel domain-containing protein n=1 Tax=Terriglobus aquaticus TaxID=940139 RepID=A0ABW9KKP0_9BACT|nr:hypothetical protein [Terriglobus aquaticus]